MYEKLIFRQISSLAKVFLDDDVNRFPEVESASALKGERVSWQILYTGSDTDIHKRNVAFTVEKDERINTEFSLVGNVPCLLACKFKRKEEDNYLRTTSGLYPDILYPLKENKFHTVAENCHSLFVTAYVPEDIEPGVYPVKLTFTIGEEENVSVIEKTFEIKVLNAVLPPQETTYTQWFHADCIATYYKYDLLSEEHWAMIEKFIAMASHTGINMILTPMFTLPLDTEVGRERPTVQLIDVSLDENGYHFEFGKMARWIDMCQKYGINKFEMSHLFSQWGTGCTPKIVVTTKDGEEKLFGWHTKADSKQYREFLNVCIPALTRFLKDKGVYENTLFHVSDEPSYEKNLEIYKTQREMIAHLIPDDKLIEACSHYQFLEDGIIKRPVSITSSVDEFFERGYTDIWAYYCSYPDEKNYSNRLIAMPNGRNRIVGFQLYKYGIEGFLHWGYNFYYSVLSKRAVNPFYETDADEGFPSGDAFSVYPGEDGPLESIRSVAFYEGLQDIRACKLLEKYVGREEVLEIVNKFGEIKFNQYPRSDEGILAIRERINARLEEELSK